MPETSPDELSQMLFQSGQRRDTAWLPTVLQKYRQLQEFWIRVTADSRRARENTRCHQVARGGKRPPRLFLQNRESSGGFARCVPRELASSAIPCCQAHRFSGEVSSE